MTDACSTDDPRKQPLTMIVSPFLGMRARSFCSATSGARQITSSAMVGTVCIETPSNSRRPRIDRRGPNAQGSVARSLVRLVATSGRSEGHAHDAIALHDLI